MRRAIVLCLLVAGCSKEVPVDERGANEAEIQRLSTPAPPAAVDTEAAARPQALTPADLDGAGMAAPQCDFSRNGVVLLAATPSDAIARVAGNLLHFAHASPAGPTGGFFEDRQISISVGRVGAVAPSGNSAGSWPGRITITNRRAHAQVELDGVWRCGT